MSTSGFSIDALLTKDTADTDDVLLERESSADTRKRTAAPLTVDWLSYGGSLDGRANGDARRQSGGFPLHRSYDSLGANSHPNNIRPGYDSGLGNASGSSGASTSDGFWNNTSDGWYNSSNVGRYNSSLYFEQSRPSPHFADAHLGRPERQEHSSGMKDEEEEEEEDDRNHPIRSSTGYVQRGRTTTTHTSSTNTAHQSNKPHAEGSARQLPALQNSTISRPWEREMFKNSSLTTSTPTNNAPIRRPWEVSPVHNIQSLDVSADNHSYLGQASRDSGYPSFGTQSMRSCDVLRSPDNAPTRDVSQEVDDDSQESNHIDTKRVQKASRTNTTFSEEAVEVMETWYAANYNVPYPSDEQIDLLSTRARITVRQARKWLANRRVRSHNTLAYNNNVHPKRARRLEKNRLAILGLAASLNQNNIEGGGANISSFNVSLNPATTHVMNNSMNRGGEISADNQDSFSPRVYCPHESLNPVITHGRIKSMNRGAEASANIQDSFPTRAPAVQVNRIANRTDETSRFPELCYSSGLSHSESDQAAFGYHQRPLLNWSTSTPNSSLPNLLFRQQLQDQQQLQRQQFISFRDRSLPVLGAPPTYLPYMNYLDKDRRH